MSSEMDVNSNDQGSQGQSGVVEDQSKIKLAPDSELQRTGECPPVKKFDEADEAYKSRIIVCINHRLREVRVEIQQIVWVIDQHLAGQIHVENHTAEFKESREQVDKIIQDLKDHYLPFIDPSDLYSEILNLWELSCKSPFLNNGEINNNQAAGAGNKESDEQDRLRELTLLKTRISKLIYLIGYATAMERLNKWIEFARPGYTLPFHRIFEDEIESAEDRQRILNLFSLKPQRIKGGLIDQARGVVLIYPQNPNERLIRYLYQVFLLMLSFIVLWGVIKLLDHNAVLATSLGFKGTPEISLPNVSFLLASWSALLIGIVGHMLVAGAKQTNAEFRQFPLPIGDWGFYLSARTSIILYKILLALLVFMSMFLLLKNDMKLIDAFLIGYSFDSVVELLGASLEKSAASKLAVYKDKLGLGS